MLKSRSISVGTIMAFLPVTFTGVLISYILMGTKGNTWASAALDTGFFMAIGLNLAGYISAFAHRATGFFVANVVLTFLMILTLFGAMAGAFPGTGGRYGNHGLGGAPYIGLVCAMLIFAQNSKRAGSIGIAITLAILIVPTATYLILSAPLYATIQKLDLSSTCLIQTSPYDYGLKHAQRINFIDDLELGMLIGEHSPRVVEIVGMQSRHWRYSERKFGRSRNLAQRPVACGNSGTKANLR